MTSCEFETTHVESLARLETKLESIDHRMGEIESAFKIYTNLETRLTMVETTVKHIDEKLSDKSKWMRATITTLIVGIVMLGVREFYQVKVEKAYDKPSPQQQQIIEAQQKTIQYLEAKRK